MKFRTQIKLTLSAQAEQNMRSISGIKHVPSVMCFKTLIGRCLSTKPSEFIDIELTSMRQAIAKRLTLSKQTIPHFVLTTYVEMDNLMALRAKLNKDSQQGKLSVNDFIIKASALSCIAVPEVNSSFREKAIRRFKSADVCVAVATPDGLITPIVFGADAKDLHTISKETKDLAKRAREKKLKLAEFDGGTFTISNLGMMGIHDFTAIINPPQSCILAIGATMPTVKPGDTGGTRVASVMYASLSCDHRVVDGAVGAQWLKIFKEHCEKPESLTSK